MNSLENLAADKLIDASKKAFQARIIFVRHLVVVFAALLGVLVSLLPQLNLDRLSAIVLLVLILSTTLGIVFGCVVQFFEVQLQNNSVQYWVTEIKLLKAGLSSGMRRIHVSGSFVLYEQLTYVFFAMSILSLVTYAIFLLTPYL